MILYMMKDLRVKFPDLESSNLETIDLFNYLLEECIKKLQSNHDFSITKNFVRNNYLYLITLNNVLNSEGEYQYHYTLDELNTLGNKIYAQKGHPLALLEICNIFGIRFPNYKDFESAYVSNKDLDSVNNLFECDAIVNQFDTFIRMILELVLDLLLVSVSGKSVNYEVSVGKSGQLDKLKVGAVGITNFIDATAIKEFVPTVEEYVPKYVDVSQLNTTNPSNYPIVQFINGFKFKLQNLNLLVTYETQQSIFTYKYELNIAEEVELI